MRFTRTKLPKEDIQSLRRVPVRLVEPFSQSPAPAYVFLERNRKFVAVKGPLGLFTREELEKLGRYESFYLPVLVDAVERYQRAGRQAYETLRVSESHDLKADEGNRAVRLPLSPPELGDALMRILGPLWGAGPRVEPFFLPFFADEACGPLNPDKLLAAHERDVDACELACLRAGAAVFFALHVGHAEPSHLLAIRDRAFDESFRTGEPSVPRTESEQLRALARALVPTLDTREITLDAIAAAPGSVAGKLRSRIERAHREFIDQQAEPPSLYGQKGVIDE